MSVTHLRQDQVILPAPAAIDGGTMFAFGGIIVLYAGMKSAASGENIACIYHGTVRIPKASATVFAAGANVQYNTTTGLAVTAGGVYAGRATNGGASGDLFVDVLLNYPAST